MNKANTYKSPLIDELLQGISPEELEKTEKRMLLAARIDDSIKARGWKRKDFAKALGKTPSEITKWLSGTHNFTSDTLFDIERVLNISLIKLVSKSQEVVKTYVYNVTFMPSTELQRYWDDTLHSNAFKPSYKAQSQSKTAYIN